MADPIPLRPTSDLFPIPSFNAQNGFPQGVPTGVEFARQLRRLADKFEKEEAFLETLTFVNEYAKVGLIENVISFTFFAKANP